MSNLRFVERDGRMILQEKVGRVDKGYVSYDYEDVPTHKEPKKVSDELESVVLKAAEYDPRLLWHESVAKAAIEFFKARIPTYHGCASNSYVNGYENAIKDVRKDLFGEE